MLTACWRLPPAPSGSGRQCLFPEALVLSRGQSFESTRFPFCAPLFVRPRLRLQSSLPPSRFSDGWIFWCGGRGPSRPVFYFPPGPALFYGPLISCRAFTRTLFLLPSDSRCCPDQHSDFFAYSLFSNVCVPSAFGSFPLKTRFPCLFVYVPSHKAVFFTN